MNTKKLNILFFCRSQKTKLMVHLAKALKDFGWLGNASAFVVYYHEWKDYLRTQGYVKFERIYASDAIFRRMGSERIDRKEIERLERTYGDQEIWNIVFSERYLASLEHHNAYNHPKYSDEDVLRFVQFCFQEAERIFEEIHPDCIIDFAAVGICRGIFNLVAQRRGIPYFYIRGALLENRFFISLHASDENETIQKTYRYLLDINAPCEEGFGYLRQFRETPQESVYRFHRIVGNCSSNNPKKRLREYFQAGKSNALKPLKLAKAIIGEIDLRISAKHKPELRYNFQLYKGLPSIRLYRSILKWSRKVELFLNPPFENDPLPDDYVLLTLHLQPEASTSVMAPFFANQRYVIENVARALPLHWKLVVKPNPLMIGREPVRFYRHIQNIPNVQLISPAARTRELILGSRAVIAITGTSGFEALLLGKKVIVLGKPIWGVCQSAVRCTDFMKLHSILRDAECYKSDDNDLAAYLEALHENSFPLEKNYIWKGPYDLSIPGYRKAIDEIGRQVLKAFQAYQESRS
ncbi:MAG: hypothetical protein ACFFCW_03190 [Candidatus Hodarchaeota archaeon]